MNAESYKMLESMSKKELILLLEDMTKRWLAHDGVWFQCVEFSSGMEDAVEMDALSWQRFAVIEAGRIMKLHHIKPDGGLSALKKALKLRGYAFLNDYEIIDTGENIMTYRINTCRVQSVREWKDMEHFPCKSVGIQEYSNFAKTIDPRIKTRCITCPPDEKPDGYVCAWEFTLQEE
ncbi:MAG: DUF6125 family protein [Desulfotomaculaceae bacterium]|nr:DUF6125 family protein [Desulfotomaculaceae bacterium]